jgi:hypothetical protein
VLDGDGTELCGVRASARQVDGEHRSVATRDEAIPARAGERAAVDEDERCHLGTLAA